MAIGGRRLEHSPPGQGQYFDAGEPRAFCEAWTRCREASLLVLDSHDHAPGHAMHLRDLRRGRMPKGQPRSPGSISAEIADAPQATPKRGVACERACLFVPQRLLT